MTAPTAGYWFSGGKLRYELWDSSDRLLMEPVDDKAIWRSIYLADIRITDNTLTDAAAGSQSPLSIAQTYQPTVEKHGQNGVIRINLNKCPQLFKMCPVALVEGWLLAGQKKTERF